MPPWNSDWAVLYKNPREDRYLVFEESPRGFVKIEVGEPITILASEFDLRITGVVLKLLDSFRSSASSNQVERQGKEEENRRFRKNHLCVSVERLDTGDLVVRPHHHKANGYVARSDEKINVECAEIANLLPAQLKRAFDLAT